MVKIAELYSPGDPLALAVVEGDVCDHLPPGAVLLVAPAGVRHVQLGLELGHQVVTLTHTTLNSKPTEAPS